MQTTRKVAVELLIPAIGEDMSPAAVNSRCSFKGFRAQGRKSCHLPATEAFVQPRYRGSHYAAGKARGCASSPTAQAEQAGRDMLASGITEKKLLAEVLERIEGTDGGANLALEEQSAVNDCLILLEERFGRHQQPRPLDNSAVFGNFNVAFSSTQRAPRQSRQPAGGRFRSGLGRFVFQTGRLCQSILPPDIVTNKVEFSFLGFLRGSIGLRGKFEEVSGDRDTVKVRFEPPRLSLGRCIDLPIGPRSSVVLTTTYLSETTRLGKGSRGSLFVFTKGGPADTAGMDRVGLGQTTALGWAVVLAALAGLFGTVVCLWRTSVVARAASVLPALLAAFIAQAAVNGILQKQPLA